MRLICPTFVCIFSILCWAGDKVQPSTFVQHASEVSDIRGPGAPPFRLTAKVRTYGGQPDEGIYELTWVSSDQWREEVSIGNEKAIRIGGRGTVSLENDSAKAQSIRGHMRLLNIPVVLTLRAQESLRPAKDQKKSGVVVLRCISRVGKHVSETEFCFDPEKGNLVSEGYVGAVSHGSTVVYAGYTEFAGKLAPAIVKTYLDGAVTREVEVTSLNRLSSVDATAFDTGAGYTTMPGCEAPVAPLALEAPDPLYPNALKKPAPQLVKLSIIVDESGTPQKINVTQSAGALDQYAIDCVKKWQFSPAMCGTQPVPLPVNIEINFRTY
jgi:TonB family protein